MVWRLLVAFVKEVIVLKVKTVLQQLIEERKKNAVLLSILEKLVSDVDYVAMMCDVSLEEDKDE